jgi:hypothetical protein
MDEQDIAGLRPQWEHHIEYISAEAYTSQMRDFLAPLYLGKKVPLYAVQATLPRINERGAQGWELVNIEPVQLGKNGDVHLGGEAGHWTYTYQCSFKRLKRSAGL